MTDMSSNRMGERGGSGTNALIALVVVFLVLYALFHYASVAYVAADVKQEMRATVLQAQTAPGRQSSPTKDAMKRMENAVRTLELPPDTYINAQMVNNEISLEVAYEVEVPILPFNLYKYRYVFDETVTPVGFLMKDDVPKSR